MSFRIYFFLVALPFCLLFLSLQSSAEESPSPVFHYDVEAKLSYLDKLDNFRASNSLPNESAELKRSRTLGLTYLRLGLQWELIKESSLRVVFRPDATLRQDAASDTAALEYDSRAGDTYFLAPRIYLLDAYQLEKKFSDDFSVAAGVFEKLATRQTSYQPLLEFGLLIPLPQKFSGLNVSWQTFADELPQAQAVPPSGYSVDFYIIQGDRDRGEIRNYGEDSYDHAPSGRDPQYGAALNVARIDSSVNEFGVLIGIADTNLKALEAEDTPEVADDKSKPSVKRNEVYGQIYNVTHLDNFYFPLKVALDFRALKEKFKSDEVSIDSRQHYTASLSTSMRFKDRYWLLAGFHLGKNEIADDEFVDGQQIDIGYQQLLARALYMTFFVSQETRQNQDGGGAFGDEDTQDSTLHRLAFELRYSL